MTLLKVILNNFLIKLKNFINDFLNDTLQVTSPLQLGSRDQNFPKKLHIMGCNLRMPKMERAYQKFQNGQVGGSRH